MVGIKHKQPTTNFRHFCPTYAPYFLRHAFFYSSKFTHRTVRVPAAKNTPHLFACSAEYTETVITLHKRCVTNEDFPVLKFTF